ncbi:RNA polymerase factor sigma-54 [Lacticaseibacillus thailandensis]|uniref:RNA polymerase factor sigma-54 n=1 Tax=Lacticaseibacillus thailandensis TaxID=381741 RepID=UPI0006CFB40F|nr:hypothetical protein [Lacticaseibacillus thailandensis]
MKLEQSIRQSQRLLLSQTMQQSLKVLQMDGFSLREYLNDLSMSNPLVDVPASSDIDVSNFEPGTASTYDNLYDYLNMQVELRYSDKPLRKVVTALIQNLDHDGLLQVDEERFIAEQGINQVQFLDALTLLQSLDPPGVGGRTLQEVLVVQARMLPDCPPLVTEILTNHYWNFLHNDVHRILTTTDATVDEFLQAKAIIGGFTAHPGAGFGDEQTQYRIPDIKVRPNEGGYRVYLTKAGRPQLVFNTDEYDELRQRGDEQLQSYLAIWPRNITPSSASSNAVKTPSGW